MVNPPSIHSSQNAAKSTWDDRTLMSLGQQSCYKLNLSSTESTSGGRTPYTFFNCTEPCKNITKRMENTVCNVPPEGTEHCKTHDICKISCCPDYDKHFNETKKELQMECLVERLRYVFSKSASNCQNDGAKLAEFQGIVKREIK
uniref:Putative metalloprotease n=1 Tax=Ixodes ricinus TaxID=34613 RepID=A0A0K8RHW8_IXORI